MSKVLKSFKRITASFLVCFMLCFSAFSSYATVPVYGVEIVTDMIMHALIEAIMASMGLAFSSTADLNNVATGLDGMMTAQPDFTYKGVKVFEEIQETLNNAKLGATISIPYVCAEWLSDWLYGTSSAAISESSDVVSSSSALAVPGVQVIYGDFSREFFEANNLFYDYSIKRSNSGVLYDVELFDDEPMFKDTCAIVVSILNLSDSTFSISYAHDVDVITYPKILDTSTELASKDGVMVDSVFEIYEDTGDNGYFHHCFFRIYDTYIQPVGTGGVYYTYTTDDEGIRHYELSYLNAGKSGIDRNLYSDGHLLPASSTNSQVRVFVDKGTRFYESYEQYKMEKLSSAYAPSSAVYGLSSASKELEEDDELVGTVSLQLTNAQFTSTIEKVVADAIAANPSITQEELNLLAAEQIGAINDVEDAVEENTEILTGLISIMTTVRDYVGSIASSIDSVFVLDFEAINAAVSDMAAVWETTFPFASDLFALFDDFNFSEDYEYPVIKMKTPDILNTYYQDEYIILCDFANYAYYCKWVRNLIKGLLWFSFALSVFNHLKTDLSIG